MLSDVCYLCARNCYTSAQQLAKTKKYKVKEIYYTLQGEGYHFGRAAVFLRFSGCNLWTGREEDRHKAICQFCDTDFIGTDGINGGTYAADDLIQVIMDLWPNTAEAVFLVCTGGEPLLQLDEELIEKFHEANIYIAIETNGTITVPQAIDWVCVSPKFGAENLVQRCDELKLVYPQLGIDPKDYENYEAQYFYLQPMDGEDVENSTWQCINYIKEHPKWRLSMQAHKYLGIA